MEAFQFWFIKNLADAAFGIIVVVVLIALALLWYLIIEYVVEPYKSYKKKKLWLSKDPEWVFSEYRYWNSRRYHPYTEWEPWMQDVFDIKQQEVTNGK